jgi:hypothetical protein
MINNEILQHLVLKEKLRFYRLANGLLGVTYIAGFIWIIVQVWNMIF